MSHVLTLIADPARRALRAEHAALARAALEEAGARAAAVDWLAPGIACDIGFEGLAPGPADEAVRQYLKDQPIDIVAQPSAGRRKALLIADMDSTIIEVECIDELASYLGRREQVAAITERAMRGELDFVDSLKARAAMLGGLKASALGRAFNDRITYRTGAHALVRTMRANGAHTALISGGFSYFTRRVRLALGFAEDRANELEIEDDLVTGRIGEPVLGPDAKLEALHDLSRRLGVALAETLAVGDGANDIPLLQAAGMGVAFHAKPEVAVAARARVSHGDLTALLYIQGYRAETIVA